MAELVDALVSGTSERMLVGVRISPSAPDDTIQSHNKYTNLMPHIKFVLIYL